MSKAILFLQHTSDTLTYSPYTEAIGDFTVVEWFCRWLERTHPKIDFTIATRSKHLARVVARVGGYIPPVIQVASQTTLHAFLELANLLRADELEILPVGLPFAPWNLLEAVREHHRSSDNQCTIVGDMPLLFSPQIFRRDGLEILSTIPVRGLPLEPIELVRESVLVQSSQPEEEAFLRALPFVTRQYFSIPDSDIPFQSAFKGPTDVSVFRRLAAESATSDRFVDGDGLREFKRLVTQRIEEQRVKRIYLKAENRPTDAIRRVLLVSGPSAFSGAEEALCTLAESLVRNGVECSALVGGAGYFSERLRRVVGSVLIPQADFCTPTLSGLEIVCEALNRFDPDVVHCNGPFGFPLLAALKLSGMPWVQHVHTADLQPLSEQCSAAHAIIAVSNFIAGQLFRLNIDPARVRVIHNPVDAGERFRPPSKRPDRRLELGLPPERFILGYPARFSGVKEHLTLFRALAEVLRHRRDVHLVLVGEPTTELELYDELRAFRERHSLIEHISELGFVAEMPNLYAVLDALVFPAVQEPFGLCILEAMAMGVPVIASRSGGIPEFVNDGETGILVEPRRPAEFASAILRLMGDAGLRTTLSNSASEYVRTRHSVLDYGRSVLALYGEVLKESRKGALPQQVSETTSALLL